MAFGPEMQALPGTAAFSITLKAVQPQHAARMPHIPTDSPLGHQLPSAYVGQLNGLCRGEQSSMYRYMARTTGNIHWGIYVTEAADQRLIGITGVSGIGDVDGHSAQTRIAIVDPAYHNQGIGTCIYPLTTWAIRAAGVREVVALVRHDNTPSLRLHQRMGFVALGSHPSKDEPYPYFAMYQLLDDATLEDPARYRSIMRSSAIEYGTHLLSGTISEAHANTLHILAQARAHLGR